MSSREWSPWDFQSGRPTTIDETSFGIKLFLFEDPFVERVILEQIPRQSFSFKVVLGHELTQSWLDENFNTYSLFGDDSSFLVLQGEQISKDLISELQNLKMESMSRHLVISFTQSTDLFLMMSKREDVLSNTINAPKFWESKKYLHFFLNYFKLSLDYQAEEFLLDAIEPTSEFLFSTLGELKLNFPDKRPITATDCKEVIDLSDVKFFEFASLYSQKKFKDFWQKLLERAPTKEVCESLFGFLSSHMLKIYDPTYIKKKKGAASKYDKEIEALAKIWSAAELKRAMNEILLMQIDLRFDRYPVRNLIESKIVSYYK